MGSSRLPGKALVDIQGKPSLHRLLTRLRKCQRISDIVLATSVNPEDDQLENWANSLGLACFRGSEDDVLARVVGAHRFMNSEIIVEVTGDCPLLDFEILELGVETFFANSCDVVSNTNFPSYPQGADVQVFRYEELAFIEKRVTDPAVREHVSLYFYENQDKYKIINLIAPSSMQAPELRLQLDYPDDLKFIRELYKNLEPKYGPCFGVKEILSLLNKKPHLANINFDCKEKVLR